MHELKIDKNCIPYPKKRLYWIINIPYLLLLILTATYLWRFSVLISSIYISLYVVSVILHGYVCAFGGCPYKGKMCPGAFAYFPVGKVALLYDKLGIKKSDGLIGLIFVTIMVLLLGIIILPLYWIGDPGLGFAVGYVLFILGYFIAFLLTICPKCAMRFNCPAAKLSNNLHKTIIKNGSFDNRGDC